MAEKLLNTRIQLRYDSYTNWADKNPELKSGEIAIAYLAESHTKPALDNNTHPVMFKVGPGNFNSLPWASALAADVYGWAKETGLTVVKEGSGNVIASIDWDASLNGGKGGLKYTTFSAAASADLETLQTAFDELVAFIGEIPEDSEAETVIGYIDEQVEELAEYVGTIPTTSSATDVIGYINEKTAGIATEGAMTELGNRVTAVEGDVATIKGDYLKSTDKTELADDIAEVQTAVNTEKSRAEGIEAGLRTDVDAIKGDYLKTADKTELQGNIDTLTGVVETLRDGIDADKVDGVKDLIDYVEEHGSVVTGMRDDIDQNATDIAGVTGRMDTAEGKITALEGAVATKVEQSTYDAKVAELAGAIGGKVSQTDYDSKIAELANADTTLDGRIATLEGKFGGAEGTVEDLIADAEQAAKDYADGKFQTKGDYLTEITTTANNGLKVTDKNKVDIDDSVVFVFQCGDASTYA